MTTEPAWLLGLRRNTYSQSGEDGVIEKILELLPATDRWCVEFGASDGLSLSNTRNLIQHAGYSAVLIEGSRGPFEQLEKVYEDIERVITLNTVVGFGPHDGLDAILGGTPVPLDFDFVSVDVDGNDYHIWEATTAYRPKLVCIEFNPTVPHGVRFVQRADPSVNQGASLLSLYELGKLKGYELVAVLSWNAFFVDSRYYDLFRIFDNRPEALHRDSPYVTHLFSGFDGTVFVHGSRELPWHGVQIRESKVQQLPRFLRKYPGNYTRAERIAFEAVTSPRRLARRLSRRLFRRGP